MVASHGGSCSTSVYVVMRSVARSLARYNLTRVSTYTLCTLEWWLMYVSMCHGNLSTFARACATYAHRAWFHAE